MKRIITLAAATVAVVAGVAAGQGVAHATTYAQVEHQASGYCLDDPGSSTTVGTDLQLWQCLGDNAQMWTLVSTGTTGVYELQQKNGLCATDPSDSGTNGTKMVIGNCDGNADVLVTLQYDNGTDFGVTYSSGMSFLNMDDKNNTNSNANPIQVWTQFAPPDNAQQWVSTLF